MKILMLCEGDAETLDSWSGVSNGLLRALRDHGHEVVAGDCDLYGVSRLAGAGLTFSPRRRRWWVRFHLSSGPFRLRSRAASRHVAAHGEWADAVLQAGATFLPSQDLGSRFFLYCDSNIHVSEMAGRGGHSEATQLTPGELSAVRGREGKVYARARKIFTMSRMLADSFVEGFGVPEARVATVHAGINFSPVEHVEEVSGERPTVLFVGKDFGRKGGDLLLEAFKLLRKRLPEARLVIIGPASNPAPGAPGVDFLGFLDAEDPDQKARLDAAYRTAGVFCLPTRFEPLGIAFLEAMAYRRPCVGPTVWAVPEMVEHEKTGLLVAGDDPGPWADAMERLLTDLDLSRRLGNEGRRRVLEYFTWDRVAGDISAEIEKALALPGQQHPEDLKGHSSR